MSVIINNNNKVVLQVLNGKNNINHKCKNYIMKLGYNKYLFARTYSADDALEQIVEEIFPTHEDESELIKFLNSSMEMSELKQCYFSNTGDI